MEAAGAVIRAGMDKLYAAIDGTGVPVTAKETVGRDGKSEDGRARTREVKLGVFFTQDEVDDKGYPIRDQDSSSYIGVRLAGPGRAAADWLPGRCDATRASPAHMTRIPGGHDGAVRCLAACLPLLRPAWGQRRRPLPCHRAPSR